MEIKNSIKMEIASNFMYKKTLILRLKAILLALA